jgi:F-type H+-transporting ATPase subunit delta
MGIQEGSIITAIALDEKYKEKINELIRKKFKIEIDLEEKVDPSIIGGFVLRIEDQQIDASISSQLKKIKTHLINS